MYLRGAKKVFNVETVVFTFGAGAADEKRVEAIEEIAKETAQGILDEYHQYGKRITTEATEVFEPVNAVISTGLGAYNVGVRIADETLYTVGIGRRPDRQSIVDYVLSKARNVREKIQELFG